MCTTVSAIDRICILAHTGMHVCPQPFQLALIQVRKITWPAIIAWVDSVWIDSAWNDSRALFVWRGVRYGAILSPLISLNSAVEPHSEAFAASVPGKEEVGRNWRSFGWVG